MVVKNLFIYPIKSLGGISLQQSEVTVRGLKYDRRWVLVDSNGRFITQRTLPHMALFSVGIEKDHLLVTHRTSGQFIRIPLEPETTEKQIVTVWDDEIEGVRVCDEADQWFSEHLGFTCYLYYQPEASIRKVDAKYQVSGHEHTSFSDAYPALVIGEASLEDLNNRLEVKVEMKRFRPNIVTGGGEAFEEDYLKRIKIGSAGLYGVKPCSRCILTTIDPDSDEPKHGSEPLKTLAGYRRVGNKVMFGHNLVVHQEGVISVGDEIVIL
ncbi:MOSC domain-containing protein [Emticicia sp. CRIBPO]|uniref:MOSC domain-containing protein n=1 Tax=Emticicia sp. CRIBPO TaxID=2683258 RepID=UPI001411C528|nr:MOSC N-terminal beta barrel domain-containing protein [Emticicia sp. CRIBPO]NBA84442.1 MOSC domain-containing protein [Emticicia sp. CRIBPO]